MDLQACSRVPFRRRADLAKEANVYSTNWGLVSARTSTFLPKRFARWPSCSAVTITVEQLKTMLESHLAGAANYTRQLRALVSLEIWFRLFIDQDDHWLSNAKTKAV